MTAHWRRWTGRPGTYVVRGYPPNIERQFFIPLSGAAMRVAESQPDVADIYPNVTRGDYTPRPAVLLHSEEDADRLETAAKQEAEAGDNFVVASSCGAL